MTDLYTNFASSSSEHHPNLTH